MTARWRIAHIPTLLLFIAAMPSPAEAAHPAPSMLQAPTPEAGFGGTEAPSNEAGSALQGPYANEGFYIGIGLGGAVVSGDEKVSFATTSDSGDVFISGQMCTHEYSACARTNYGAGLSTMLRLGYNIRGAVALEVAFVGHGGNLGKESQEGQGHLNFNAVIHPTGIANLVRPEAPFNMRWDPYLVIGGGFSYGGYHATFDDDTKGWKGTDLQFGAGINFRATPHMVVGLDVRMTTVFHDTFLFDWGKDIEFTPEGDPTSLITTPMLTLSYHP